MIAGHLDIVDGTVIGAASGVGDSITVAGVYNGGFPALPQRDWMRLLVALQRLRSLVDRVRALEQERAKKES